jgi:hypothetical protein
MGTSGIMNLPPPNKRPNVDRAIGVLSFFIALLLFVLQENGVVINWIVSIFLYLLVGAGCVYSLLAHAIPHLGPKKRILSVIAVSVVVGGLGALGTLEQYHHDHPSERTPARALAFHAVYFGIRNLPERSLVTNTWDEKPWDEDDYADVRLTITNTIDSPLQNLDLVISVVEGDPKAGIAGIAQLTDISGVEFRKPSLQIPDVAFRLRGEDGKPINFPFPAGAFEHTVVSQYRMFCPRLEQGDVIRLILATIYIGAHNRPPDRANSVPAGVRQTGMEGALNGTRKAAQS